MSSPADSATVESAVSFSSIKGWDKLSRSMRLPLAVLLFVSIAFAADVEVPRTWTDEAVREFELPLADAGFRTRHISEADYYRIPERVIYRAYPVYHPDHEPEGYWERLQTLEPEVAFPEETPSTQAEWIAAGELVFNAPTSFGPVFFGADQMRDKAFLEETGTPVAADGTIPFATWVIREKGKVELGSMGCNTCHIRVLDDGTVVPGAQGNNPGDRQGARMLAQAARFAGEERILKQVRQFARQFELPWRENDLNRQARTASLEELIAVGAAIPPGVTARSFTSMYVPPQIPDLIGVRERKFLDHTGLVRHRGPADLMRYSSMVQDMMGYAAYGEHPPMRATEPGKGRRYSDAQLYALTQYLYSLQPPKNPNPLDALAERGAGVFKEENCGRCHTAPLYTNNRLVAVDGFEPSEGDRKRYDVMSQRVGTDPRYALQTKKGTGYYKVPSLKGVWYRGPFEHNGGAATLEEWFGSERVERTPGHPFGTKLPEQDKAALIAFLKTL